MQTDTLELFKPVNFEPNTLSVNVDLDEYFFLQQMQNRIITINAVIDDEVANAVVQSILRINLDDVGIRVEDREPIKLIISSDGGDVFSGFSIIDVIKNSATPVHTFNISHWYSMATIIGMVGDKRYATSNASFLIHDGTTVIGDSSNKVHDFLKFDTQLQKRMKKIVLDHSLIASSTYTKKSREEWYFFAEEAKKLGVIDEIIGEDVTLEKVI